MGSRGVAERLVADGAVRVDGQERPKNHRLGGGETIEVALPEAQPLEREEVPLHVAFEDPEFLVIDKPAGVVVHPSPGQRHGTLVHGLLGEIAGGEEPDRPGIVHRLDRDTSGLMVVARSQEAHRRLQNLLRRGRIERSYVALVRGKPRSWSGRIEAPIGRDRTDRTRHSLDTETPRDAITHFEVRELLPEHALLAVRLETGRTHQIRVHLEAIDLPVAGDPIYGVRGDLGLDRQFLHAARLAFPHPFNGAAVEVESALPPDLERALSAARAV